MGRMHSGGKGIASSSLPYKRNPAAWLKVSPSQVEDHVNKLAKRGLTPSQVSEYLKKKICTPFLHKHESDWCNSARFPWHCSGKECYRKQNS